ncbi:M20/M25/M40 family metallo-hydrolase [Staphylococcus pragensis]|uniref:M20/M25/M40 family metallo-hydrolase n=1 Tax=Staphylococcus pragensis TaxID=1611836 RepID=A0A4Z1BMS7_9STAP|nr:M20/M25/M40 family metallo-hydrolase [Staphylococcus pragensis]RTX87539.1 M20/M25/M40 family metallo-hydrolase [Staphylococcus carnosus]TGN28837.1 M20/M25/M40 family metallo-hydrolase [Staphylococcus pragensis]GGG84703.1 M20 family peptidase [Staphylococcus pragensis]
MVNSQRLLNTFLELVQINSETGHEEVIQPILKQRFEDLGLEVKEDNASEKEWLGANNLICTLPSTTTKKDVSNIYFTSHMDTVVPGIDVKPQVKDDGYIYSDGTTVLGSDDKAGLAAIIEAIEVLKENNIPHGQIQFVITVGEESGLKGAKELDPSMLDAQFGYAVDASQPVGTTVVGAPTQMVLKTTILGKTAHASTPNEGISAINIAAKAISKMSLGQIDDYTTANIGKFHGGSATNIVADEVIIEAEARSHNDESIDKQVAHMKEVFETTAQELGGQAKVEIEKSYPGFKIEDDNQVTQYAINSAHALGLSGNTVIAGGGSDGSIINTFGIPTVILGVGYEHIHTTSERIAVESLNQLAQQLLKIIELVSE